MDFASLPHAPGAHPVLGHVGVMRGDRMRVLRLISSDKSSPLLRFVVPPPLFSAVGTHPDVAHQVLVEKAASFEKSDMLRFSLWNLVGNGLFTATHDPWKRNRRLMATLFTPRALEGYAPDMVACTLRTMESWRDGEEILLAHETTRLTMGVAGRTLFDADTFSESDEIGDALTVALDWSGEVITRPTSYAHIAAKRLLRRLARRSTGLVHDLAERATERMTGPLVLRGEDGKALRAAIGYLDAHVAKMIADRRASLGEGRSDLLSRLLDARDEQGTMDDRQVRDEVLTLFVAGHETTATGLAWTMHLATHHPDVYRAMQREADAVSRPPTSADLPRLDLCLRAFKEALRLYPPVYLFGRDTTAPVEIAGVHLPVDVNVLLSPWALHHDARFWPAPERFDPDRFLPEREEGRHRFAYLPFGAGPRVCIGNHFSYMEAALVLATLLQRWDFEPVGDEEPDPSATLRARHGVRMRIRRRT